MIHAIAGAVLGLLAHYLPKQVKVTVKIKIDRQ